MTVVSYVLMVISELMPYIDFFPYIINFLFYKEKSFIMPKISFIEVSENKNNIKDIPSYLSIMYYKGEMYNVIDLGRNVEFYILNPCCGGDKEIYIKKDSCIIKRYINKYVIIK